MYRREDRDDAAAAGEGVAGAATVAPVATPDAAPVPAAATAAPQLADGVELIGRYEDSGFKHAPYLIRRSDGQMLQLSELLFLTAKACDGSRGVDEVAETVTREYGKRFKPHQAAQLIEGRLRRLGVLRNADGGNPPIKKANAFLALKVRTAVIPQAAVNAIAAMLRPLFFPPVVAVVLLSLLGLDIWIFGTHGVAQAVRGLLNSPTLFLLVFALIVLSAAFHEGGHAAGCRYGGARPGVMGAGLYVVWPAFYTDVTDAYRLSKRGRLRTDLGGVYFNCLFILATAGAYFVTRFEPLLVIIVLQHLEMLHQFLPSMRLDGYYVVADATGVPDLFTRIRPVLRSLVPFRRTDPRVEELKGWVRVVVTAWVMITVPALLIIYGLLLISAPRMFATAAGEMVSLAGQVGAGFGHGDIVAGVVGVLQMLLLGLPLLGVVLMVVSLIRKLIRLLVRSTAHRPLVRGFAFALGAAALAISIYAVGPRGNYRPLTSQDRGTISSAAVGLVAVPLDFVAGRPLGSSGASQAPPVQNSGAPGPAPAPGGSSATQPPASTSAPPQVSAPVSLPALPSASLPVPTRVPVSTPAPTP